MPEQDANKPEGRPKEYADDLQTISISLPVGLLKKLGEISKRAGISRQRLVIEWLTMSTILGENGMLTTSRDVTAFDPFPLSPPAGASEDWHPMTYGELAEICSEAMAENPDAPVRGMSYVVSRDIATFQKYSDRKAAEGERIAKRLKRSKRK